MSILSSIALIVGIISGLLFIGVALWAWLGDPLRYFSIRRAERAYYPYSGLLGGEDPFKIVSEIITTENHSAVVALRLGEYVAYPLGHGFLVINEEDDDFIDFRYDFFDLVASVFNRGELCGQLPPPYKKRWGKWRPRLYR